VSTLEGYAPIDYFYFGNWSRISAIVYNNTYSIIISTIQRSSFTVSSDPWYLTSTSLVDNSDPLAAHIYTAQRQRPVLSCWQTDIWSYQGHNATTAYLISIPNLNFPTALQTVLFNQFGYPKIVYLAIPRSHIT
jgi:hypothetical protein